MSNSNPNQNPTGNQAPAATTRKWESLDDQRFAAKDFLQATIDDTNLRAEVLRDRKKAKSEFAKRGKINIPDDVEVICVDCTKEARSKVVLFILPEPGDQLSSDTSVLKYWAASWTPYSSARFKRNVQPMGDASTGILSLRPVTFRYKEELDPEGVPQFGLVAEDVEKANPDLVVRDDTGKPYTVRYDAVNAMLLNEFLKQHGKIKEQEKEIAQQRRELDSLKGKIEELSVKMN